MWREIGEKPEMKKAMKVAAAVIAVISAFDALSDFPEKLAKDKHIILAVVEVIVVLVILIASYALVYMSIDAVLFLATCVVLLLRRLVSRVVMSPSAFTKWLVVCQAIALALTVYIGIATHGRVMSVFTYFSDKAEKDNYNKIIK
jgi:hypothetical protein